MVMSFALVIPAAAEAANRGLAALKKAFVLLGSRPALAFARPPTAVRSKRCCGKSFQLTSARFGENMQ
jgi:hypothetical protein